MSNTTLTGLHNGDLAFDIEKIKGYDKPKVKKDGYDFNEEPIFTIEVNDNTYTYLDKDSRNADYVQLKKILSGKPMIKVSKSGFVDFMLMGQEGTEMFTIAKALARKGTFTVEDLLKDCGYIPSNIIKNKKEVPKNLRDEEDGSSFEVNPENFIVILV